MTQLDEGLAYAKNPQKGLKADAPTLRWMQLKKDHLKASLEGKAERAAEIQ